MATSHHQPVKHSKRWNSQLYSFVSDHLVDTETRPLCPQTLGLTEGHPSDIAAAVKDRATASIGETGKQQRIRVEFRMVSPHKVVPPQL